MGRKKPFGLARYFETRRGMTDLGMRKVTSRLEHHGCRSQPQIRHLPCRSAERGLDEVRHTHGLGDEGQVRPVNLFGGGAHARGEHSLRVGRDRVVMH